MKSTQEDGCYRSKCALSMNNLLVSRNCDFTYTCKLIRLTIFYLTNVYYDGRWTADVLIYDQLSLLDSAESALMLGHLVPNFDIGLINFYL